MATVSFDTYHADDVAATGRTNNYLVDGHGAAIGRTNRYILSHSPDTPHAAHNCPDDAFAATEYMEMLRANYERMHNNSKYMDNMQSGKGKMSVTHVQFYNSWAEHEDVSAEEALAMNQEWIERTPLKDFACFCAYHDNTWISEMQNVEVSMEPTKADGSGNKHVHTSVCPFSLDGTHKLLINNELRYTLWREANKISYEHGYSIVNNPKLLADPEYRKWFEQVAAEGKIKIHPYRHSKGEQSRKERGSVLRQAEKNRISARVEEINKRVREMDPSCVVKVNEMTMPRYDPGGKEYPPIALDITTLSILANRVQEVTGKNFDRSVARLKHAGATLIKCDITTRQELYEHRTLCGNDIYKLKQEIARQSAILDRLAPLRAHVDDWETNHTSEAYHALKAASCASEEEREDLKKKYMRAEQRKAKAEQLLAERQQEYKRLKDIEYAITSSHDYIYRHIAARYISSDDARKKLSAIAKEFGIPIEEIERLSEQAAAQKEATLEEIRKQRKRELDAIYQMRKEHSKRMYQARYDVEKRLPVTGPVTLVLSMVWKGLRKENLRLEQALLDGLHNDAMEVKRQADTRSGQLLGAKRLLAIEILMSQDGELDEAFAKFEASAQAIRDDIELQIKPWRPVFTEPQR